MQVRKSLVPILCLAAATAGLIGGPISAQPAPAKADAAPDISVIHVQVLLDRLGFGPGVIDGHEGQSLTGALRGFQTANGIAVTGKMDRPTLASLARFRAVRPTRNVKLSAADLAGPFAGPLPKDPAAQAKLPNLGYATLMEALSERYHTTPKTLIALNSPDTKLAAGSVIRVPNALPASRDYPADLPADWRATLSSLNVDAVQPQATKVVVTKSEGVLKVYGADDKLVAQFPATMGSEHDPLPIGTWKIQGKSYNPQFHYNPKLFWDADKKKSPELLPPGPNGPVGVIWLDLNKPHYGIHGTPSPETIGRAESHGCIRLSNWDAARLSLMVKAGTPAIFEN